METKNLYYKIVPPCSKCPYKLGLVHTPDNPCPQCRQNGYHTFERIQKRVAGNELQLKAKKDNEASGVISYETTLTVREVLRMMDTNIT